MGLTKIYGVPGLPGIRREARILDGTAAASAWRGRVAHTVRSRRNDGHRAPVLATVFVGDDPASQTYVAAKHRACAEVGIDSVNHEFAAGATHEEVGACIHSLNENPAVSGILLQLPLPGHLDARGLLDLIDPVKDVDGLTTVNIGRLGRGDDGFAPCTAKGILRLLDYYEIPLEGRRAVVVGRSDLVGRPTAALLSQRHATVTICHSRSRELETDCRRADVLVVAAGQPQLVGRAHVREGGAVIDVGIHRTVAGLAGDVDFDAVRWRAGAVSPVPGGVGPMTIAALLDNTLLAAGRGAGVDNCQAIPT